MDISDEMNIIDEMDISDANIQTSKSYNETVVIENEEAKNGQTKCPKCGVTDIGTNAVTGKLRCNFCRYEFEPETVTVGFDDISTLKGRVITSGAKDIIADTNDILTLRCESCGVEVVIDTASSTQARCHWCRNNIIY